MSEKWNIAAFGGSNAEQATARITERLDDEETSGTRLQTEEGTHLAHVRGYSLPSGESTREWLIDQVKLLEDPPDWAVVTHANTTEDGGRAWVFRNHDGHMDIIDIVLGHGSLFGEDVETYLEDAHGVSVPVWMDTVPGDSHISVGSIGKAMSNIPPQTMEQAQARYPLFDILGTLTDPIDETRPETPHTGSPTTEERDVTLSTGELAFLQKSLRDYSDYDAEEFIDKRFSDGTFTGTWDEFKETFWEPLDSVLSGLYEYQLTREEDEEVRGQANTLKWQAALDWHR